MGKINLDSDGVKKMVSILLSVIWVFAGVVFIFAAKTTADSQLAAAAPFTTEAYPYYNDFYIMYLGTICFTLCAAANLIHILQIYYVVDDLETPKILANGALTILRYLLILGTIILVIVSYVTVARTEGDYTIDRTAQPSYWIKAMFYMPYVIVGVLMMPLTKWLYRIEQDELIPIALILLLAVAYFLDVAILSFVSETFSYILVLVLLLIGTILWIVFFVIDVKRFIDELRYF
jgi:hypothetical protein